MKKIKILIVIKDFEGGTGTFLSQLVSLSRYNVKVCSLRPTRKNIVKNKTDYLFCDNKKYLDSYKFNPFVYLKIINEINWLKKIILKEKPALVLTIDTHAAFLSILSQTLLPLESKPKIINTIHNNISFILPERVPSIIKLPIIYIGSMLFNRADEIIFVSKGLMKDTKKMFSIKKECAVIPCGINLNKIKEQQKKKLPMRYKKIFRKNIFNIISTGRFEKQKNFSTLIEALSLLKKQNINLILLGEGSRKNILEKTAFNLGLKDKVHFLGWKDNIFPYLKSSDVFALSSNYEGFSYAIIEAMGVGLPVISNNPPYGPSAILDNGKYGVLINNNKPENFANGMKMLMTREVYLKYSEKSKERAKFYTEEKMLNSYDKLILQLITN